MRAASVLRTSIWTLVGLLCTTTVALFTVATTHFPIKTYFWLIESPYGWVRAPWVQVASHWGARIACPLLWVAWMALRPRAGRRTPVLPITALWLAPLLLAPPVLTADPWAYASQGWLLAHGMDPYTVPMGFPGPYSRGIYPTWRPTTAVYPPFALLLQEAVVRLAGFDPWWGVVGMRGIAVLGLLLMVVGTALLAQDLGVSPRVALWGAVMNPLVTVQLIGGAHNDSVMIGLVAIALWLARRRRGLVWGSIAIGVAAMFKQPAVLAGLGVVALSLPPHLRRRPVLWTPILGRLVGGGLIGGATFVALSLVSGLGFGWASTSGGSPSLVINHSPLSWLAQAALRADVSRGIVDRTLTVVTTLAIVAAIVWCARRWALDRPVLFTAGTLLAFGLLGSAIQPWYVLWGGTLLGVAPLSRRGERVVCAAVLMLMVSSIVQVRSVVLGVVLGAAIAGAWYAYAARRANRRTPAPARASEPVAG